MSSNDMSGDLILEDINTGERFVLKSSESSWECGRSQTDNVILAKSILVSRKHCLFIRLHGRLNVIDNKSSNGVYINGRHQQPRFMNELRINDLIGIGCADVEPSPPQTSEERQQNGTSIKVVYRLKLPENEPQPHENNVPFEPGPGPSNQAQAGSSGLNKRRQSNNPSDFKPPHKKIKTDDDEIPEIIDLADDSNDGMPIASNDWNKPQTCGRSDPFQEANLSAIKPEPDAVASTSRREEIASRLQNGNEMSIATGKSTCYSNSEKVPAQDRDESHRRGTLKNTKAEEPQPGPAMKKAKSSRDTNSREKDFRVLPEDRGKDKLKSDPPAASSTRKTEQVVPSRRSSADSSASEEEIDILKREFQPEPDDEDQSSHSSWKNVEDFAVPGFNVDHAELGGQAENDATTTNDDVVVDQGFKYEPDLQITDVDESAYADLNNYSQTFTPTPIKLKRVKQEPITAYSQFDVVTLSDDEDDVFPASQLFGDDEDIETESKFKIKNELNNENEEDDRELCDRRENDYTEIMILSDSEEEDNPFYDRLMRAELNASRESETNQLVDGTEIDVAAVMSPKKEAAPLSADEEAAPFSAEEEAALISAAEDAALMSPDEDFFMSSDEDAAPVSAVEEVAPMSAAEEAALLSPDEEAAPASPAESIPEDFFHASNVPREPPVEEADGDSPAHDILEEIYDLCYSNDKRKTAKKKKHEKKVDPADLRERIRKLTEDHPIRKPEVEHRSSKEDSTSTKTKSADNKVHHKKQAHEHLRHKSDDRATESEDGKGSYRHSKSYKHDSDRRRHSSEARSASGSSDGGHKKRDSTEIKKSKFRDDAASNSDSSSKKKRHSTEAKKSNLRPEAASISEKVDKKRHSAEFKKSNVRPDVASISEKGDKKRDSTEVKKSNLRPEAASNSENRDKKRDSTEARSNLHDARSRPGAAAVGVSDSSKKKRHSAEGKSHHRAEPASTSDRGSKKRDSTEVKSNLRAEARTSVDDSSNNNNRQPDSPEVESNLRTEAAAVAGCSNDNRRDSLEVQSNLSRKSHAQSIFNGIRPSVVVLNKVDAVRKSVQLVDAPHIPNGQRRGVSCNIKRIDRSANNHAASDDHATPSDINAASTSTAQPHETNGDTIFSPKGRRLSRKEEKELADKAKEAAFQNMKEKTRRRQKNPWASCLPVGTTPPSMSRDRRDEIKVGRREKLKELADKKKEKAEQEKAKETPVPRICAKAKAKVTMKTRNDFLVNELVIEDQLSHKDPTVDNRNNKVSDEKKQPEKSVDHPPERREEPRPSITKEVGEAERKEEPRRSIGKKVGEAERREESRPAIAKKGVEEETTEEPRSPTFAEASEETTTKNCELPMFNAAPNFYRETAEVRREDSSLSRLGKESLASNGGPVLSKGKLPKIKKKKGIFLDPGKENEAIGAETCVGDSTNLIKHLSRPVKSSLILEQRTEASINNRNVETSKALTGLPIDATMHNGAEKVLEEGEIVDEQTTNNNLTHEKDTSVASRDPRMHGGKPDKLKSLLKKNGLSKGNKPRANKRVTFNDLNTKIKLFEIDSGNSLRKCQFKDAPSTIKNPSSSVDRSVASSCPKLEEFLLRIFEWNPVWLEEQKVMSIPPPVVNEKQLVPMPPKYETYEDYYQVAEPILALELWHGISSDFEGQVIQKSCMKFSIVNYSVTREVVPATNVHVTTLMIEVVVSRKQLQAQAHPLFGDLIFFEYVSNRAIKGSQRWKVFAYVTKIHRAELTPYTQFNRDLLNFVQDPHTLLTFTVMTKPLNPSDMQTNKINRMGTISYLRSNIRMVQAIQSLPSSPLMKIILHPKVEDFQLPPSGNVETYPLVTKDKLNAKQMEAVARVTEAVIQKLPKICLIHGPPGTGKSKVIVNIITQILYGRGKGKKNSRILVCAPSNAAVDEIVLRLLDIRQTFEKGNRFAMVRIGRETAMHPLVKHVSLSELAKKNVKSTADGYMAPDFTAESIAEEKQIFEAQKNCLELQLANSGSLSPTRVKQLARKLADVRAQYDLLMNRRPAENLDPKESLRLRIASEHSLLKGADVIACTLTSCLTNTMESIFSGSDASISVCIVDEATQSIEAETLVPLMLGVKTLVLVGDTNQLPATVLSQKAKQLGLDQSLFARIQRSFEGQENNPIIFLDTQYRMSYPVAFWPNRHFYGGALKNCANLQTLPFHFYRVINLDSTQDIDKFCNTNEANFVANLVYTIMARSNLDDSHQQVKIGIITPYNNQKRLVARKIKERTAMLTEKTKKKFVYEVNTVDSFQGQERDIIIMSCVRSNGIGFLSDRQRLCVALTRARHSLFLCGNFMAFQRHPMWNALLSDARSRKVYLSMRSSAEVGEITRQIIR